LLTQKQRRAAAKVLILSYIFSCHWLFPLLAEANR
jgi:hypothetical protein